ncbi:hypothetical protein EI555_020619, partial [Monodon monoceros]
ARGKNFRVSFESPVQLRKCAVMAQDPSVPGWPDAGMSSMIPQASLSTNGSISTTPSGPKTTSPSTPVPTTEKEEVITVIIYSVMAVIIGIILISAQLIGLLIK